MAVVTVVVVASVAMGGAQGTSEWLSENAVPKTTETRTFSGGDVSSINRIQEYSVQIKQKVTETTKRDENGALVVSGQMRTTDITDAFGGKRSIKESNIGGFGFVVTDEVEMFKSGNVTETTTRKRSGAGKLLIVRRVTRTVQEDGTTVTVTESRDASGSLAVKSITTQG